jgi:hypothetical protein
VHLVGLQSQNTPPTIQGRTTMGDSTIIDLPVETRLETR